MSADNVPHVDGPESVARSERVDTDEVKGCENELLTTEKIEQIKRTAQRQVAALHLG